jgi:hypothetical protein
VIWRSNCLSIADGGAVPSAPGNPSRPGAKRWMIQPGTGSMCAMAGKVRSGAKRSRDASYRERLGGLRYRDRAQAPGGQGEEARSNAAPATPLGACARVAKAAHRLEACLQRSKSAAGWADAEGRHGTGGHHPHTLS